MSCFVNPEQESAMIVLSVQVDSEVGTNWIGLCKPELPISVGCSNLFFRSRKSPIGKECLYDDGLTSVGMSIRFFVDTNGCAQRFRNRNRNGGNKHRSAIICL
jgi:hypothetical protein